MEEHLNERGERSQAAPLEAGPQPAHHGSRSSRWARWVSDVMTASVVTVDRITPYQEIARLLTEHKIGGVPVLMMDRESLGFVSGRAHAGPDNEVQSAAGAEGEALGIAGGYVENQPCIVP